MRRFIICAICLMLIIGLSLPAMGANYASKINVYATVNQNESCQVTVSATLHLEENSGELLFPVPLDATGISVNGSRARTTRTEQAQHIDLSGILGNMVGEFTVTIQYTLPDVIHSDAAGQPELQLPLLSGFAHTVSLLDFSVTMPGEITAKPAFSSGYHQSNIEKDLIYSANGLSVSGSSTTELKDHETLTMTLTVDPALFPNAPLVFYESDADDIAMGICAAVALLYWLLFLRCLPPRRRLSVTAPEGVSAGQLGAVMTLGTADLSLMVFSWAQLGYIQMQVHKNRVVLYKRMDMGNERTSFEQRCFKNLFGKKDAVDTSGLRYANLVKEIAKTSPNLQPLMQHRSGNPRIFRALAALIALFGGVSFGIAMSQDSALQGFWMIVIAAISLFMGWFMQGTFRELFLRKGKSTYTGLLFSLLWLGLGAIAGQFSIAVTVLLSQWLAGLMAFFGGRRTDAGRQDLSQILGLRRYLITVSKDELKRIQTTDPEYFHNLAPYALALGVEQSFARRFGKSRIPACPYITAALGDGTAHQWCDNMRRALREMDRRSKSLPLEKLADLLTVLKK